MWNVPVFGSALYLMLCEGHPKDFELFKELLQHVELSGIRILHNPDDLIKAEDPEDSRSA